LKITIEKRLLVILDVSFLSRLSIQYSCLKNENFNYEHNLKLSLFI